MRQIATIPSSQKQQARLFVDYLGSMSIEAKLESGEDGLELWICDEDQVEKAREEHEAFLKEPDGSRYTKGADQARSKRAERAKEDAELRRREEELHKKMYHVPKRTVTVLLVAVSIIVTLMREDPAMRLWVIKNLFIAWPGDYLSLVPAFDDVLNGEVWRLITPTFIHFDGWHLVFNMLWLVLLGTQIETREGSGAFLGYVVVLAISSNVAQYIISNLQRSDGWIPVIHQYHWAFGGFSGVVFGLFGFVWIKSWYQPSRGYYLSPFTVFMMLGWLYLCMTGAVGRVANTAHLMGLLMGLLLGYCSAWWQGIEHDGPRAEGT